jgi:hypothetical protein
MIGKDPDKDWLFDKKDPNNSNFNNEHIHFEEELMKKRKNERKENIFKLKIKNICNNFKYRFCKRRQRKNDFSIRLILGIFAPLLVALSVLYLLLPGMPVMLEYLGDDMTISWLLILLLIPAEVNSIVPWIAWIAAGFVGGAISRKILIPFFSMYILIWLLIYFTIGDIIFQQFSIIKSIGLEQIVFQTFVINFIYAILAFAFGGWLGLSIRGR